MSDHAPDDSMGVSDLDGFLTGIVVGPELILPSEWLPVIWGGKEPVIQTEDEMRTVLGRSCGEFLDAAALRRTTWKPLIEDDGAGILMAPLFLLNGDMEITDSAADENKLLAEASDMITTCIAGIHEFWRNYQNHRWGDTGSTKRLDMGYKSRRGGRRVGSHTRINPLRLGPGYVPCVSEIIRSQL